MPEPQLAVIRKYIEAEKPVLGIRTASHAFQNYPIDDEVFCGSYSGHDNDEPVDVKIADDATKHPILEQVEAWTRKGKLYHNRKLGENTTLLLSGTGKKSDLHEPLAWTHTYGKNGRVFYTSMGYPDDFKNQDFRQLLLNAIEWTTEHKLEKKPSPAK